MDHGASRTSGTTAGTGGLATAPAGLRERKKERTREALIDAALELFWRKGYDATTIDEIVAAVDVSRRTFFRYFAGKEEVALARSNEVERSLVGALAERPSAEPPVVALRQATRAIMAALEGDPKRGSSEAYVRTRRLIEANPTLMAATLRHAMETERLMAAEIARRQGVDPHTDLRPALTVSCFNAVVRVAMDEWTERGAMHTSELAAAIDEAWRAMAGLIESGWLGSGWASDED
ncbi:TetR family transcriptional regulator [Yinghuangia seranimata]|uniref:TetR family transcriptional regulator n=1 Tax=Yinghuangia seranimata TaxID=408067 RepID=UPI00248C277B|nr:TetR family transcriptional regulator [Yinghuangia seranimata]MDI2126416.1 TetR family transcriptional regulator [Yinghuangia seranimata]